MPAGHRRVREPWWETVTEGVVASARITHETGGLDDLTAASPESQRAGVSELLSVPEVEEAYVLSTCNRVEAYVVAPSADAAAPALGRFFAAAPEDVVVQSGHDASLTHLLEVATGLDSVVLGEDQILGQVRTARDDARAAGGIGDLLEPAVEKAIHVGERARAETEINEGVVSLGSAAAKLVAETVGVDGALALVVGAGEMGRLAAESLTAYGAERIVLANRTVERAEAVLADVDVPGDAVGLGSLATVAPRADVVVTATGSAEPLLGPGELGGREQVVVDLGQPRDVDPAAGELPAVTVYDMDDLEAVTRRTRQLRADAAAEVEAMIDEEYERLDGAFKRARADGAIAAMYESAERIKRREVETALTRLESAEAGERAEIVESMADALVGQLLAAPTKSLREAAAEDDMETIAAALELFDPEFGPDGRTADAERADAGVAVEDD